MLLRFPQRGSIPRASQAAGPEPKTPPQRLLFPLPMPTRVALFAEGFLPEGAVKVFRPGDLAGLGDFMPEAIIAPRQLLLDLGSSQMDGILKLPHLNTALVALTGAGEGALESADRDFLWLVFGLPVFEQFRNDAGTVIARECEIHDGLHLDPVAPRSAGLTGRIVTGCCECGSEAPRVVRFPERVGPGRETVQVRRAAAG